MDSTALFGIIHRFHYTILVNTILFQLIFTFIYNTFNKKFQFQQNKWIPNRPYAWLKAYQHKYQTLGINFWL